MIDENELKKMFLLAGIDKTKLHETLRQLGPPPKKCKDIWTPQRPTTGYCYTVTEVVSHVMKGRAVPHKIFRLDMGNCESHWFIRIGEAGKGEIVDLTADQQDDPFDYEKGKRKGLQKNQYMKHGMSDRAEALARKMEVL